MDKRYATSVKLLKLIEIIIFWVMYNKTIQVTPTKYYIIV